MLLLGQGSKDAPLVFFCEVLMISFLQSILREPAPLVLLLYGTHGTELPGSLHVARRLAIATEMANPHAYVELLGPISPWSCRHAYRFDRYLGDPNRLVLNVCPDVRQLSLFSFLWHKHRPESCKDLHAFLEDADSQGLFLPSFFQTTQTVYPGVPGFVCYALQSKRLSFLLSCVLRRSYSKTFSSIFLVDVHTGIGPHAWTHVYYHRHKAISQSLYLVDGLAVGLEEQTGLRVEAMITETGVISNETGMLDALSELAFRTHGYTDDRNLQFRAMDSCWQANVDYQFSALSSESLSQ